MKPGSLPSAPAITHAGRKVTGIQALRALAALSVALVHLTWGFGAHIDGRLSGLPAGDQLAQAAVALFFVISGCVMVLSSDKLFGSPRASLTFWRRRAVRVLPPYWIATFMLVAVMIGLGQAVNGRFVAQSLMFVPVPSEGGKTFQLFLWPGWTLLYELIFYTLFGAAIGLGRIRAIAATSLVLAGLVVAGEIGGAESLALFIVSRPVVLLFPIGMLFGLALQSGCALPGWLRWVAAAASILAFALPDPAARPLGFGYLAWAGLPAILVFAAAVCGPLRVPWRAASEALGDASYAIYLIHVPFAHAWMWVFSAWWGHPGGSLGYVFLGMPLLVALSLAYHRAIERPLTNWLNRLLGDRPKPGGDLTRTLAP
jgi:peptidoglycan/LPS O-acetylase OafA/YrhL